MLVWVKTACRVLRSRLTYFWRNMNISCIFYFSKSTSINTQYSSPWGTLKMMLFRKYLIKWKRIGRISWNFRHWFDFKSSIDLDIKRQMLYLSNAPFTFSFTFTLRGYCTSGLYFWRLCAFSQKIKQLRTKHPMDLVRNVPRNSKITVLVETIVVKLQWKMCENQYFPCFEP